MPNKTLSAARLAQGAVTLTEETLIGMSKNGQSIVGTIGEIASVVGGYANPASVIQPHQSTKVSLLSNKVGIQTGVIGWTKVDYDDSGFFSAGAPTRFTVPTGVLGVRIASNFDCTNGAKATGIKILMNGSTTPIAGNTSTATDYFNVSTYDIPVTAGDYFEVQGVGTNYDIVASSATWFSVTVTKVSP